MVSTFLKSSARKGLWFKRGPTQDIMAYNNADYVGSVEDRKSIIGFRVFTKETSSWHSKQQNVVFKSSADS